VQHQQQQFFGGMSRPSRLNVYLCQHPPTHLSLAPNSLCMATEIKNNNKVNEFYLKSGTNFANFLCMLLLAQISFFSVVRVVRPLFLFWLSKKGRSTRQKKKFKEDDIRSKVKKKISKFIIHYREISLPYSMNGTCLMLSMLGSVYKRMYM
jgi:hypothetical protein